MCTFFGVDDVTARFFLLDLLFPGDARSMHEKKKLGHKMHHAIVSRILQIIILSILLFPRWLFMWPRLSL